MTSSVRSVAASALLLAAHSGAGPSPRRLAIYYGYPSLVNGARGDLAQAVSTLSRHDVVVLGDGLELDTAPGDHAGPAEHAFTTRLIGQLARTPRRTAVYGYVDLGRTQRLPLPEVVDRIGRWAAMGAAGVLLDEAGYDFGVTRERQNAAIRAAHVHGLSACLNAFRPGDVFEDRRVPLNAAGGGNPGGASSLMSERDAILLEPFALARGVAEAPAALTARIRAALDGRRRSGARVFAIAAGDDHPASAQYGWWIASVFGLDAYGYGPPDYGAAASRLPPPVLSDVEHRLSGARFVDRDVRSEGDTWCRATTAGTIVVSATARRGTLDAGKDTPSCNGRMR